MSKKLQTKTTLKFNSRAAQDALTDYWEDDFFFNLPLPHFQSSDFTEIFRTENRNRNFGRVNFQILTVIR